MPVELVLKNKFGRFYVTSEGWKDKLEPHDFIVSQLKHIESV